jgi:hypothetical protein
MSRLKLCVDCTHGGMRAKRAPDAYCLRKCVKRVDLVTGAKRGESYNDARSEGGSCGIEGKFFEPVEF